MGTCVMLGVTHNSHSTKIYLSLLDGLSSLAWWHDLRFKRGNYKSLDSESPTKPPFILSRWSIHDASSGSSIVEEKEENKKVTTFQYTVGLTAVHYRA